MKSNTWPLSIRRKKLTPREKAFNELEGIILDMNFLCDNSFKEIVDVVRAYLAEEPDEVIFPSKMFGDRKMYTNELFLLRELGERAHEEGIVAVEIVEVLGSMIYFWTYDKDGNDEFDCMPNPLPD